MDFSDLPKLTNLLERIDHRYPEKFSAERNFQFNFESMSRAFVKESDDEPWLNEIAPTMHALINHLTRENGGRKVFENKNYINEKDGKEVHMMSNGLSYVLNEEGRWQVLID